MAQEKQMCKTYACFNVHNGKIFGCWVDEYTAQGDCVETDFNGDVKACMEYWTAQHLKKGTRCFVKIFEID